MKRQTFLIPMFKRVDEEYRFAGLESVKGYGIAFQGFRFFLHHTGNDRYYLSWKVGEASTGADIPVRSSHFGEAAPGTRKRAIDKLKGVFRWKSRKQFSKEIDAWKDFLPKDTVEELSKNLENDFEPVD